MRTKRDRDYENELARLEKFLAELAGRADILPRNVAAITANPTAELIDCRYTGLADRLNGRDGPMETGQETLLLWFDPASRKARIEKATEDLLLALKLAVEGPAPSQAARESGADPALIKACMDRACRMGLVLQPESLLRREPGFCDALEPWAEKYLNPEVFTLQWHLTQACDLNCRHCYDRSERSPLTLVQGLEVLDQLEQFVDAKQVSGHVTFTGGNPLMYQHLDDLYQAAADRGFEIGLLANPTSRKRLETLLAIKEPAFIQVSLEGLPEHNDYIRGPGHYQRTMEFLDLLNELGVYSMVMLTLTRANMDQVLPLARELEDRCDLFTFNRLSAVGEGANLICAPTAGYREFLGEFLDAAGDLSCLGLKDNLLNPVREDKGEAIFGGCTGHGCGAAFNFAALLPDGELHACRKFPSHIGNVFESSLTELYDSAAARAYRMGSSACRDCRYKPVCGGCLAVVSSSGMDPFSDLDPYCFVRQTATDTRETSPA
jgi:selenobiotic family peptide radical SAM maturase